MSPIQNNLLGLAVHEAGHAAAARQHGIEALPMLNDDGISGLCVVDRQPTGEIARLVGASGPVGEYLLQHPHARPRHVWHAYRAGLLTFSSSDLALAHPITHRLLGKALALAQSAWTTIVKEAEVEVERWHLRHFDIDAVRRKARAAA